MTETTAGTTRPSFGDAYEDLTGLDDRAIALHLGYDIDELFELLNDGALSSRQWLQIVEALEFVAIRRRPNTPDEFAAQLVKEMKRKELGDFLAAYMAATFPDPEEQPDADSPEGKDSSPSTPPGSPTPSSTEASELTEGALGS